MKFIKIEMDRYDLSTTIAKVVEANSLEEAALAATGCENREELEECFPGGLDDTGFAFDGDESALTIVPLLTLFHL